MAHRSLAHLSLFLGVAIGCGPSVPDQIPYRLLVDEGATLQGSVVTRDGAEIGSLSAAGALEFTTEGTVRPSAMNLAVTINTQCGSQSVPLELQLRPDTDSDETIASAVADNGVMIVRASLSLDQLSAVTLFVDRGEDVRPVRVGEATLPVGPKRVSLFVGDCARDAPVRVADEVIGTWHASSSATLVSVEPACHQLTTVGYGDAITGSPHVFGQRVRALSEIPEYVLENAPSSLSGTPYSSARYVQELVRTECPSGPPSAQIAAEAFERGGCLQALPALRRAVAFDQDDLTSAVRYVGCIAMGSEAMEAAREVLAVHPEARERIVAALREAGHESQASTL